MTHAAVGSPSGLGGLVAATLATSVLTPSRDSALTMGEAMRVFADGGMDIEARPLRKAPKRKLYKCGLPGCNNMTWRGYCNAAHCKEHRAMLRERDLAKQEEGKTHV